ncbi:pyridoxamine 5'-phosphate oxidase family protein [Acinetobacter soli]|uniref:pyridoxamine 5'-phosphate oxidase family protein n=1 Tax=Acinetobacter soli TaxID=487316 RepID=UPI00258A7406|nr:pyridoxamine 5'-phosphate oxidase family protein [uncultured Acinetobacter sp.]
MDNTLNDYEKIEKLIQHSRIVMVTFTNHDGHLHSAPMTRQNKTFDGNVFFIGAKHSELVQSITSQPEVNLAYSGSDSFVSISGKAQCINDPQLLEELWSPAYQVFFKEGLHDPDIQLIQVTCHGAQYWEGDGKLVTLFKLAKASVTGEQDNLGESKSMRL